MILVSKITVRIEGSRFPQTNFKYRCTNKECQAETDRQTAKRLKMIRDKAKNDKERAEKKQLERNEKNRLKIEQKANL